MRLIHCRACADGHHFASRPATPDGPGETVRRVEGRALYPMLCDSCNRRILPHEEAVAWTAWRDDQPEVPAWEHTYLGPAPRESRP